MSSNEVAGLLAEYALGTLDDDAELARARELADNDANHAAELASLNAALADLAFALEPVAPSADTRDRLLAGSRRGRFAGFADKFAAMFDVTVARAKELLDWVDDPSKWETGPGPGTALIHFSAGPACAGADTGFVRVEPGTEFPWHLHTGEEANLVLQGACVDADGALFSRGDMFVNQADTQHDFRNPDDTVDYIYAVKVFGVDFSVAKPSD